MKKKIVAGVIAFIVVLALGTTCFLGYQSKKKEQDQINQYQNEIKGVMDSFDNAQEKADKLSFYKELESSYEDYQNAKAKYDEIDSAYEDAISKMTKYFEDYYDEGIQKVALLDLSTVEDREEIKQAISDLNQIQDEMKSDQVLEDISDFETKIIENIANYNDKIDELTNSYYDGKLAEINTGEDLSTINDKALLTSKAESLNNLITELDSDEFIKSDKLNELKDNIQNNVNNYNNRVAEIDEAEKAEAERLAAQQKQQVMSNNNSTTSKPASNNNANSSSSSTPASSTQTKPATTKQFSQVYEGKTYYAPANVSDLYYNQNHGIQLQVWEICEPIDISQVDDPNAYIPIQTNVFWVDHTTGIWYWDDGSIAEPFKG